MTTQAVPRQKIAIVGAGIAGLAAAYLLYPYHDIDVFEKNDYLGGQARTVLVKDRGRELAVDVGFTVYDPTLHPNLARLLTELDVPTEPSQMGFALSCRTTGLEYTSANLFNQPINYLRPVYWQLWRDIRRFHHDVVLAFNNPQYDQATLGQFAQEKRYSSNFKQYYLEPIASVIGSARLGTIYDFSLSYLLQSLKHHGQLPLSHAFQWRTITGGSQAYIRKLTAPFIHKTHPGCDVRAIKRFDDQVNLLLCDGSQRQYDQVIVATHADQALKLLADPTPQEKQALGRLAYQANRVVLHSDESVMPQDRSVWAGWNAVLMADAGQERAVMMSYWLNALQNLRSETHYFVTVNPLVPLDPAKIILKTEYEHHSYAVDTLASQSWLNQLNGRQRTYFCGGYFGHGFHEDGLNAGVQVARALGAIW
jgi:predicted NAD/FAD-binding protein